MVTNRYGGSLGGNAATKQKRYGKHRWPAPSVFQVFLTETLFIPTRNAVRTSTETQHKVFQVVNTAQYVWEMAA